MLFTCVKGKRNRWWPIEFHSIVTVEPLNKGHTGIGHLVLSREGGCPFFEVNLLKFTRGALKRVSLFVICKLKVRFHCISLDSQYIIIAFQWFC